jgi:hypothetical protein
MLLKSRGPMVLKTDKQVGRRTPLFPQCGLDTFNWANLSDFIRRLMFHRNYRHERYVPRSADVAWVRAWGKFTSRKPLTHAEAQALVQAAREGSMLPALPTRPKLTPRKE